MYNHAACLFSADVLELLVRVQEVVGIRLWSALSLVWLLHKVLITLLLCESDRRVPAVELDGSSLHEIGG